MYKKLITVILALTLTACGTPNISTDVSNSSNQMAESETLVELNTETEVIVSTAVETEMMVETEEQESVSESEIEVETEMVTDAETQESITDVGIEPETQESVTSIDFDNVEPQVITSIDFDNVAPQTMGVQFENDAVYPEYSLDMDIPHKSIIERHIYSLICEAWGIGGTPVVHGMVNYVGYSDDNGLVITCLDNVFTAHIISITEKNQYGECAYSMYTLDESQVVSLSSEGKLVIDAEDFTVIVLDRPVNACYRES